MVYIGGGGDLIRFQEWAALAGARDARLRWLLERMDQEEQRHAQRECPGHAGPPSPLTPEMGAGGCGVGEGAKVSDGQPAPSACTVPPLGWNDFRSSVKGKGLSSDEVRRLYWAQSRPSATADTARRG